MERVIGKKRKRKKVDPDQGRLSQCGYSLCNVSWKLYPTIPVSAIKTGLGNEKVILPVFRKHTTQGDRYVLQPM
jgi:hypothetical protein